MTSIEKRFRKELRTQHQIDLSQPLFLIDDDTPFVEIAHRLLFQLYGERVPVVRVSPYTAPRKNLCRATSLEQELTTQLATFLEGIPSLTGSIPLLCTIPEAELRSFAKRHAIRWDVDESYPDIRQFIEGVQEKHPSTKSSLRKSFAALLELSEK
jgi:hypothetical protein